MGVAKSILSEEHRKKLDGIVSQMEANGESEENIRFVVDDFKSKYGKKKEQPVLADGGVVSQSSGEAQSSSKEQRPSDVFSFKPNRTQEFRANMKPPKKEDEILFSAAGKSFLDLDIENKRLLSNPALDKPSDKFSLRNLAYEARKKNYDVSLELQKNEIKKDANTLSTYAKERLKEIDDDIANTYNDEQYVMYSDEGGILEQEFSPMGEKKISELNLYKDKLKRSLAEEAAKILVPKFVNEGNFPQVRELGRAIVSVSDPELEAKFKAAEADGGSIPSIQLAQLERMGLDLAKDYLRQLPQTEETKSKLEFIEQSELDFDLRNVELTAQRVRDKLSVYFYKKGKGGFFGYSGENIERAINDPEAGLTPTEKRVGLEYVLPIEKKLVFSTDIAGSGFWRAGKNAIERSLDNAGKSVSSIFGSRTDKDRAFDLLNAEVAESRWGQVGESSFFKSQLAQLNRAEKERGLTEEEVARKKEIEKYVDVRSNWAKFLDGTGDLTGQVLEMALLSKGIGAGGKALTLFGRGGGLVTGGMTSSALGTALSNPTVGLFLNSYLNSYDNYRTQALSLMPGDENTANRDAYAKVMAAIEGLSEKIFVDTKVLKAFTGKISSDVADISNRLINREITQQLAREELQSSLMKYLRPFGKEFGTSLVQESTEEAVVTIADGLAQSIFGGEEFDLMETGREAVKTFFTTALHSGVVSGMAAHGAAMQNRSQNAMMKSAIVDMAANPTDYLKSIERLRLNNEITPKEANEKIKIIKSASQFLKEVPNSTPLQLRDVNGNVLTVQNQFDYPQVASYLIHRLNEGVLQERINNTTDDVLKAKLEKELKRSQEIRKGLLDGKIGVTPFIEEVTDNPEKAKELGIASADKVNSEDLIGTPYTKPDDSILTEQEEKAIEAISKKDLSGTGLEQYVNVLNNKEATTRQKKEALRGISDQLTAESTEAETGVLLGKDAELIYDLGYEKPKESEGLQEITKKTVFPSRNDDFVSNREFFSEQEENAYFDLIDEGKEDEAKAMVLKRKQDILTGKYKTPESVTPDKAAESIETKKADIETRREEAIRNVPLVPVTDKKAVSERESKIAEINKEFDDELAELESQQPSSTESTPALKDVESTAKALEVTSKVTPLKHDFENQEAINDNLKNKYKDKKGVVFHGSQDISYLDSVEKLNPKDNTKNAESKYFFVNPSPKYASNYSSSYNGYSHKSGVSAFELKGKKYVMTKNDVLQIKNNEQHESFLDKKKEEGYDYVEIPQDGNNIAVLNKGVLKLINTHRNVDLISESYHKAKKDGSNPELVKAVEDLLGKPTESKAEPITPQTEESTPKSKEEVSDVESKKADIERRRQEELKDTNELIPKAVRKSVEEVNAKYDAEYINKVKRGEFTKQQAKDALKEIGRLTSELEKQIDDAELAALQSQQKSESNVPEVQKEEAEKAEGVKPRIRVTADQLQQAQPKKEEPEKKKEAPPKAPKPPRQKSNRQERINDLRDKIDEFNSMRKNDKRKAAMLNEIRLEVEDVGNLKLDYGKGYAILKSKSGKRVQRRSLVTNKSVAEGFDKKNYSDQTNEIIDKISKAPMYLSVLDIKGEDGYKLSESQQQSAILSIREGKPNMGAKAIYDFFEKATQNPSSFDNTVYLDAIGPYGPTEIPLEEFLDRVNRQTEATDMDIDELNALLGEDAFNEMFDTEFDYVNTPEDGTERDTEITEIEKSPEGEAGRTSQEVDDATSGRKEQATEPEKGRGRKQPTRDEQVDDIANEIRNLLEDLLPADVKLDSKISLEDLGIQEGDDILTIVEKLIDYGGEFTPILNFLKSLSDLKTVKVKFASESERANRPNDAGSYIRVGNQSWAESDWKTLNIINPTNAYYTIVHELLHFATLDSEMINKFGDKKKLGALNDIYNYVVKETGGYDGTSETYGLYNFREFMVELAINPQFRSRISDIVAKSEKEFQEKVGITDSKSLVDIVVDFIKDIIEKIVSTAAKEGDIDYSKPLLDSAVKLAQDLFFDGQGIINTELDKTEVSSPSVLSPVFSAEEMLPNASDKISEFIGVQLSKGVAADILSEALVKAGVDKKEAKSLVNDVKNERQITMGVIGQVGKFLSELFGGKNNVFIAKDEKSLLEKAAEITGRGEVIDFDMKAAQDEAESVKLVKDKKGNLLAPNGQVSNLNEEQWKIVRTPAFKNWFGDWENDPENASKIVDENGEPQVMYHGTNSQFNEFKHSEKGKNTGWTNTSFGFFFIGDKKLATEFTRENGGGDMVLETFLNIRKPIDFRRVKVFDKKQAKDVAELVSGEEMTTREAVEFLDNEIDLSNYGDFLETLTGEEGREFFSDKGYDGAYSDFGDGITEYIAINPSQIKLADGTNRTFDSATNDIRYQNSNTNAVFETRDGKIIGYRYDTDKVARERFDFSKLKKIGQGSDRVVFDLGDGNVLKVAKTARGLEQNIYEGDWPLVEDGILPEVRERGLNYIVVEKVDAINGNKSRLKTEFTVKDDYTGEVNTYTIDEMLDDLMMFDQGDFDNNNKELHKTLAKYGLENILSYDVMYNDFTVGRNWGVRNGKPIHLDGGTFGGVESVITQYSGKKNLEDEEFREIYNRSRQLKKEYGDTDKFTMFHKDLGKSNIQLKLDFENPAKSETKVETKEGQKKVQFESASANADYPSSGPIRKEEVGGVEADPHNVRTISAVWSEDKNLQFTGTTKVKNASDVAHIMRLLEDKSVEHGFAVHVDENGDTHIQFLSIGGVTGTVIDPKLVLAGVDRFKSKKVYLVHNHPSGNLKPSEADIRLTEKVRGALSNLDTVLEHVIMDTYKQEYTLLDEYGDDYRLQRADKKENESLVAHRFDGMKSLRKPIAKIISSESAAQAIYGFRFSAVPKAAMLILNTQNQIIGNYVFTDGLNVKEVFSEIGKTPTATGIIFYGNQPHPANLNQLSGEIAKADIRLLDYINVLGGGEDVRGAYESSADQGLLHEVENKYGTNRLSEKNITPEIAAQVEGGQPMFMGTPSGEVLGFKAGNKIYLNGAKLNPNTPIHEAGHIWTEWVKENNRPIYDRGMELVENTSYLKRVKASKFYQDEAAKLPESQREEFFKNEALAAAIGDKGAKFVSDTKRKTFKAWMNKLFDLIASKLGFKNITPTELANLTFDQFAERAAVDILKAEKPQTEQEMRSNQNREEKPKNMADEVKAVANDIKNDNITYEEAIEGKDEEFISELQKALFGKKSFSIDEDGFRNSVKKQKDYGFTKDEIIQGLSTIKKLTNRQLEIIEDVFLEDSQIDKDVAELKAAFRELAKGRKPKSVLKRLANSDVSHFVTALKDALQYTAVSNHQLEGIADYIMTLVSPKDYMAYLNSMSGTNLADVKQILRAKMIVEAGKADPALATQLIEDMADEATLAGRQTQSLQRAYDILNAKGDPKTRAIFAKKYAEKVRDTALKMNQRMSEVLGEKEAEIAKLNEKIHKEVQSSPSFIDKMKEVIGKLCGLRSKNKS